MNTPHRSPSVALLGIGRMGLPMAIRLCQAGLPTHVWNRNRAKAEPLAAHGATVHEQLADAVGQADLVISMLENGPVVEQVLFAQGAVCGFFAAGRFGFTKNAIVVLPEFRGRAGSDNRSAHRVQPLQNALDLVVGTRAGV